MKISQKHILLFLASRFGSEAVNVTLTDEAMGPYDDKAAPYLTDTDEPMGLGGGYATWNATMGKSGRGQGSGKSGHNDDYGGGYKDGYAMPPPPETSKPTMKPTMKPTSPPETSKPTSKTPHTPSMPGKGKSGSKSGAKYGYGYKSDYQYGYNEGYSMEKTMKPTPSPTPSPAPPCPYLNKVKSFTANSNFINDALGELSVVTFGINPVVNAMNETESVAELYGSCFVAPSTRNITNPDKQELACKTTIEFSSKDSLFIKYKVQYCQGGNTTVAFNGVAIVGTGCLCGTKGSIFKGTYVPTDGTIPEYFTYDLSSLSNSCGDGGWSDAELDQLSCPP